MLVANAFRLKEKAGNTWRRKRSDQATSPAAAARPIQTRTGAQSSCDRTPASETSDAYEDGQDTDPVQELSPDPALKRRRLTRLCLLPSKAVCPGVTDSFDGGEEAAPSPSIPDRSSKAANPRPTIPPVAGRRSSSESIAKTLEHFTYLSVSCVCLGLTL